MTGVCPCDNAPYTDRSVINRKPSGFVRIPTLHRADILARTMAVISQKSTQIRLSTVQLLSGKIMVLQGETDAGWGRTTVAGGQTVCLAGQKTHVRLVQSAEKPRKPILFRITRDAFGRSVKDTRCCSIDRFQGLCAWKSATASRKARELLHETESVFFTVLHEIESYFLLCLCTKLCRKIQRAARKRVGVYLEPARK